MIIGIDNGNSHTKSKHFAFPSGLKKMVMAPPSLKDVIKFNDKYYALTEQRQSYKRDKTEDEDMFVLTLFGIAKEIVRSETYDDIVDVDLAVGLPVAHYSALKEKFNKYFLQYGKQIHFEYGGKPFNIKLTSVGVYIQGFAAVAVKNSPLKQSSRSYAVDIGGFTVDVIELKQGVLTLEQLLSLETGVITMFNSIIEKIAMMPDALLVKEADIVEVLMGEQNILTEKYPQIVDLIEFEAQQHLDSIINSLRERGIDLRMTPVFFIGGGSLLLKKFIENSDLIGDRFEILEYSTANAYGYELLHQASLAKHRRK